MLGRRRVRTRARYTAAGSRRQEIPSQRQWRARGRCGRDLQRMPARPAGGARAMGMARAPSHCRPRSRGCARRPTAASHPGPRPRRRSSPCQTILLRRVDGGARSRARRQRARGLAGAAARGGAWMRGVRFAPAGDGELRVALGRARRGRRALGPAHARLVGVGQTVAADGLHAREVVEVGAAAGCDLRCGAHAPRARARARAPPSWRSGLRVSSRGTASRRARAPATARRPARGEDMGSGAELMWFLITTRHRAFGEERGAREHAVQDDAERIDVGTGVDLSC